MKTVAALQRIFGRWGVVDLVGGGVLYGPATKEAAQEFLDAGARTAKDEVNRVLHLTESERVYEDVQSVPLAPPPMANADNAVKPMSGKYAPHISIGLGPGGGWYVWDANARPIAGPFDDEQQAMQAAVKLNQQQTVKPQER